MTREEAWDIEEAIGGEVINKIFDYFENRVCSNCKIFTDGYATCSYSDNYMEINKTECIPNDFGCNKWEKKE